MDLLTCFIYNQQQCLLRISKIVDIHKVVLNKIANRKYLLFKSSNFQWIKIFHTALQWRYWLLNCFSSITVLKLLSIGRKE